MASNKPQKSEQGETRTGSDGTGKKHLAAAANVMWCSVVDFKPPELRESAGAQGNSHAGALVAGGANNKAVQLRWLVGPKAPCAPYSRSGAPRIGAVEAFAISAARGRHVGAQSARVDVHCVRDKKSLFATRNRTEKQQRHSGGPLRPKVCLPPTSVTGWKGGNCLLGRPDDRGQSREAVRKKNSVRGHACPHTQPVLPYTNAHMPVPGSLVKWAGTARGRYISGICAKALFVCSMFPMA